MCFHFLSFHRGFVVLWEIDICLAASVSQSCSVKCLHVLTYWRWVIQQQEINITQWGKQTSLLTDMHILNNIVPRGCQSIFAIGNASAREKANIYFARYWWTTSLLNKDSLLSTSLPVAWLAQTCQYSWMQRRNQWAPLQHQSRSHTNQVLSWLLWSWLLPCTSCK